MRDGWDAESERFTASFGDPRADAATLMMAMFGFPPAGVQPRGAHQRSVDDRSGRTRRQENRQRPLSGGILAAGRFPNLHPRSERRGLMTIFACCSGSFSASKAAGTSARPTVPVTSGEASTLPSASRCSVLRNSSGP